MFIESVLWIGMTKTHRRNIFTGTRHTRSFYNVNALKINELDGLVESLNCEQVSWSGRDCKAYLMLYKTWPSGWMRMNLFCTVAL